MSTFTADQKAELREAFVTSRRDALAESRRLASIPQPAKSPVVRAAQHAERAQSAKTIVRAIVGEPRKVVDHCVFCGAPAKNGVCRGHSDLIDGGA